MTLKTALPDREYAKFREISGEHVVAATIEQPPSSPIPVNIVSGATGGEIYEQFSEISSVATSAITPILTYTIPAGKQFYFMYAESGGTNIADYRLTIDSVRFARKRTYLNGDMWVPFDFRVGDSSGKLLSAGQVLVLEVVHDRPDPGDFEARIFGILEDV